MTNIYTACTNTITDYTTYMSNTSIWVSIVFNSSDAFQNAPLRTLWLVTG